MSEDRKRAALYARVSTDEQATEGYSLESQLDVMRAYCDIHDMDVVGEFVDDGYSGRSVHRPAYTELFSPEVRSTWDVLLVMKMDRIHRNSRNFMDMMFDLNKHHQEFVSTYDKLDTTTAMGRLVMDLTQRIAQFESEQIGERTYMGMRQKAEEKCGFLGSNAPFGYLFDEDGELVINPEESVILKEIYSRYLQGETMDSIAYDLNRRFELTRKGNPWNKWNLRTILHNPMYAGYAHWEELMWKGYHEPLVSVEDYNKVQMLIASKIRNPCHRNCILIDPTE